MTSSGVVRAVRRVRRAWRLFAAGAVHAAWRWVQQVGTVTAETAAGQRFASFGPGSLLAFPTGSIYGEQWITVGAGTMVGEQASICAGMAPGHDLGPGTVLRIGDGCVIGRGSHIVAHHSIDIGDGVFTGPYVYITDQNHSYADPEVPIGRQWPVNAPVSIGAGTWLGTGTIVLPGATIGRNVVVAAGSVVRGAIGDLCVVAGAPARVVKVFDPDAGWTRPLPGSEAHIEALVNEALAAESLAGDALAGNFVLPADAVRADVLAPDVLPPDVLPPDVVAPDVLPPDVLAAGAKRAADAMPGDVLSADSVAPGLLADRDS